MMKPGVCANGRALDWVCSEQTTVLAPLEDRAILEREGDDDEVAALRTALRESCAALKRSAAQATNQLVKQANEINYLREINARLKQQLATIESGHAIIKLGCTLLALDGEDHSPCTAYQRLICIEETIRATQGEYLRMASERTSLLHQMKNDAAGKPN